MLPNKRNRDQSLLWSAYEDTLDQKHPLYLLTNMIDWQLFESAFKDFYSKKKGRPSKPIRLMCGLLMLKHIRNISDESVVEQWSENSYYQHFCGETSFVAKVPCNSTELVHFRKRIGEAGIELILKESIRVCKGDNNDKDDTAFIDSTVQEKNITYPTDAKMHRKIITKCLDIVEKESLPLRQSYILTLKKLSLEQRFRSHPKNRKRAYKADKKVKTIAGRLVRELERNLGLETVYQDLLNIYKQVLSQTRSSKNKIYSLH